MNIQIYSNPNCVQCEQTKRYLAGQDIEFEEHQISEHPEIQAFAAEKGFMSAPIVIAGERFWSGFRFEQLRDLVRQLRGRH